MDVQTRRLRYFVAVAEELHFGRAAARFYVAQQAISRQIRELEAELGVILLDRSTRRVALTPPGESFLFTARRVLDGLDDGVHSAQAMERATAGVLTVGFRVGAALELTPLILAEMKNRHPGVRVELRELDFRFPERTHDDEPVDVAILRTPFAGSERESAHLFTEPRVLAIAARHPLARSSSVSIEEFADLPVIVADWSVTAWDRFWTLDELRGGPPDRVIRSTSHLEEMELVAAGEGCAITIASSARYAAHPEVSYVPIVGASPCAHQLVWVPAGETEPVRAFVAAALTVRDANGAIVSAIERPEWSAD